MYDDILGKKEDDLIKLKLNFKLGETCSNGRMYKKEDLLKEFYEQINKRNCILVTLNPIFKSTINLTDVIGLAKTYNVESDGTVVFKVKKIINDDTGLFNDFDFMVKLNCIGNVDENNVIYNLKFKCLSLI